MKNFCSKLHVQGFFIQNWGYGVFARLGAGAEMKKPHLPSQASAAKKLSKNNDCNDEKNDLINLVFSGFFCNFAVY